MTRITVRAFSVALSVFSVVASAEEWLFLDSAYGALNGFLGMNFAKVDNPEESYSLTSLTGAARQENNWQGFIYRPWISTATMSTKFQANYNQYDIEKSRAQTSLDGAFTSAVSLYPGSAYPTTFNFSQRIRKVSGSTDDLVVNTDFMVENSFQPEGESYRTKAKYRFTFDDSKESSSGTKNDIDLAFADSLESSDYSVLAHYDNRNIAFDGLDVVRENMSLQYGQYWLSEDSDSTVLSADISSDSDKENGVSNTGEYRLNSEYLRAQATLTSFIRSQAFEKLNYFMNGYVNSTERDSSTLSTSVSSSSARFSSGANYDYSEQIRYSASVDAGFSANNDIKTTSASANISIDYQDQIALSNSFTYSWFANDSISFSFGSNSQRINVTTIGDNFIKAFQPFGVSLILSLNQSLSHEITSRELQPIEDNVNNDNANILTDVKNEFVMTNSVNMNISANGQGVNTNIAVRYSDVRRLTDDIRSFKQGYVSLQRDAIIGHADNWGGNFTYDWSRTIDIIGTEVTTSRAFGDLWYRNTEVWNVPNLRFTSLLSYPFNSLLADSDLEEKAIATWKNDLDYRIGFLEVGLHAVNTEESYFISFDIKRNF